MSIAARLALLTTLSMAAAWAQAGVVEVQVRDAGDKALPQAVVYLESREAAMAARPQRHVEIAQVGKQFNPRVTVVSVGTAVDFPNRDTVRHHVYSFSPAKNFELKLYAGKPENPVVFDRPGVVALGCNIHDQMSAWVVVVETPYHGRTEADGRAVLEGVPPGAYRLRTWHAGLPVGTPPLDQAIVVGSAATAATVRLQRTQQ